VNDLPISLLLFLLNLTLLKLIKLYIFIYLSYEKARVRNNKKKVCEMTKNLNDVKFWVDNLLER